MKAVKAVAYDARMAKRVAQKAHLLFLKALIQGMREQPQDCSER